MAPLGRIQHAAFTTALIAAAFAISLAMPPAAAAVTTCTPKPNHWYAAATSGYPARGTRLSFIAPTQWSVDRNGNNGSGGTMDEAGWLINHADTADAIEGGYFSGYWPYSGGFFTGLLPYATLGNGSVGQRGTTYYGAGWRTYSNVIESFTPTVRVYQPGPPHDWTNSSDWNHYPVANGMNHGQGEVTGGTATWLGNGSGNRFDAFWTDNGTSWYSWGYHNDCQNDPYFINSNSANAYTNGGY